MEVRILGPVDVFAAGQPVAVPRGKQRLLLSVLVAASGRRVSRDVLIEALWPERAPGESSHALDLQVSRLRRAIGASRIVTDEGGYRLDCAGVQLDVDRFTSLVGEARSRRPAEGTELLREALALWRGPAFGEFGFDDSLRESARSLDEQRLAALEALYDAELAQGVSAHIVGELEELVAEEPLRERPREQLMLALYRCGRQADAVRVYDTLRRHLAEELGISPGDAARRLHEAILRRDASLDSPTAEAVARAPRRFSRVHTPRWRVGAGSLAVGAAVLAAVALATAGHDERVARDETVIHVPVEEQQLAFIDLRRGDLLASEPIARELGDGNATFAQGPDFDWLAAGSGTLLQIDSRRRRIVRSISLGFPPGAIALGLGSVWVAAQDRPLLVRIDPVYGSVERRYRLPNDGSHRVSSAAGLTVARGALWVAQGEERVLRVDPRSGRVLARIRVPGATGLAADDAVWVSGGRTGVLSQIDPATNAIVTRTPLDPYLCCVAVGGGYVWAMNHRVWKIAFDGHVVSSVAIDGDGANLAWSGGAIWVSEGVSGQETRIRPRDDATRTVRTGGLALHTAVRGDVATVVTGDAPQDLLAGVHGPVARIELGPDVLQPDDPALASASTVPLWREQMLDATCARLLTLSAAPAPLGWRVASEVAKLPTSRDGRRWTFRIQPGFRFSPPSREPVTAGSMRHTIERALSPRMGASPAPSLLSDVVGLAAYRAGRSGHVRGVRAHRDRLTIELRSPARDLPLRMTSRTFCAVPARTPPGTTRFTQTPLPSAGPYYVATHYGGLSALLRPNPGYRGPRPARFGAFLYEMGLELPAGVERVAGGRADLVAGAGDVLRSRSSAARQFGRSGSDPRPRWSALTLPATDLIQLRTEGGPLVDPALRRAVVLALDRPVMAGLFDDVPTARALPPRVAGSVAVPMPRINPVRARALVGRRRVTLVFSGCRIGPACPALASLVQASLRRIGVTVRVESNTDRADLTFRRVAMPTPDPLGFLARAGGPKPPRPRPDPARAATVARDLDSQLTRRGAVLAFGTPVVGELASPRLGCREHPPLSFGDDLATLCPRG